MTLPRDTPLLTVCPEREPVTKAHWSHADMKRSVRLMSRYGQSVEVFFWEDGWEPLYTVEGHTQSFPWEAN